MPRPWPTGGRRRLPARKIKKREGVPPPAIELVENPDILRTLAHHADRPGLVIGFAAETGDLEPQARAKLARKGCDWILANDVSPGTGVFGGASNRILLLTGDGPARGLAGAGQARRGAAAGGADRRRSLERAPADG